MSQWHLSTQHLSLWHLSISGISQLLLTWFWPNFKSRFLGQSLTDDSCHGDICPGNNCPGNICPYREYLSSYWPNFDQTFWTHMFWSLISFYNIILWNLFFWTKILFDPNFFYHNFYGTYFFLDNNSVWPKAFGPQDFLDQIFWTKTFLTKFLCDQKDLRPKTFPF